MNNQTMYVVSAVVLSICGMENFSLGGGERSVSVLIDWLSNEEIQKFIELTDEQEKKLLIAVQRVRIELDEVLAEVKIPNPWEGPTGALMTDQLETFKKKRSELYTEFEDLLFKILRPDQGDKLLGRLVRGSGPRSLLESSELRKRMKLTPQQQQQLEQIYFGFQELWEEIVHEGDKLQFINDLEGMNKAAEANLDLKRRERLLEKIWDIDKEMTKEAQSLDEEAMRVLTPEQKLLLDSLREKGAPNP